MDRGGFRSPLTLGYADRDAPALFQTRDARLLTRTGAHEDILPTAGPSDEDRIP